MAEDLKKQIADEIARIYREIESQKRLIKKSAGKKLVIETAEAKMRALHTRLAVLEMNLARHCPIDVTCYANSEPFVGRDACHRGHDQSTREGFVVLLRLRPLTLCIPRNNTRTVGFVVEQPGLRSTMPVISQKRRRRRMTFLARSRRGLQQISPYLSLLLLLVPLLLVEPLKVVALIIAGKGHWLTGTAMLVAAYAASLLVIERLFRVLKPKIMTMGWFNRLWTGFVALRERLWRRLARPQDMI
jgi:hypothetical protein